MRGILTIAILTVAIPVRPESAPAAPAPPAPLAQIQGSWQMVDYKLAGKMMAQSTIDNISITITEDEMRLVNKNAKANGGVLYSFSFDPSKSPATFDFKGKTLSKIGYTGILKVEGDLMTMSFVRESIERPKQFDVPMDGKTSY